MTVMSGLMLRGGRVAELVQQPVPEPGPGQVLLRIMASGLCGSDFVAYRKPAEQGGGLAIISGHEPAGVVVATGPQTKLFHVDDRVFAYHVVGCGVCHQCRNGYMVMCKSPEKAAYGGGRDGGHAEYMLAEERTLVALPDELNFADGAMLACSASTAYGATLRGEVTARDTVLVVGLGPVGLCAVQFCVALGARVIAVEPNALRATRALELGVEKVFAPGEEATQGVADWTKGAGVSVSIECAGNDRAREFCLEAIGQWGRVVYVGFGGQEISFNPPAMILRKQTTLRGSWVASLGQMEDAAAFMATRNMHTSDLVTHYFKLEDGPEAYRIFDGGKTGKVIIQA